MTKEELDREITKTVAMLPQDLPEEKIEELKRKGLLSENRMIYRVGYVYNPLEDRRERMAECTCSACKGTFYAYYHRQKQSCSAAYYIGDPIAVIDPDDNKVKETGDTIRCQNCGKGMQLLHSSRIREMSEISYAFYTTIHEVKGHLALLQWRVAKYVDKDANTGCTTDRWEGVVVIDRKMIRVTGYVKDFSACAILPRWTARKKYTEEIGELSEEQIEDFDPEAIKRTDSVNSALETYLRLKGTTIMPGAYLWLWTRWPQAENLIRQGYGKYLTSVIKDAVHLTGYNYSAKLTFNANDTRRTINWREVKPHRMLGLDKEDAWIAKSYKLETVDMFKRIRADGIHLGKDELDTLESFGPYSFHELLKEPFCGYKVPPVRLIHYMKAQRLLCKDANIALLRDYWNMVNNIYGRMEPGMLWPKSLKRAHDNLPVGQLRIKEEKELDDRLQALLPIRERLAWEDKEIGLMIRPARTQGELIEEGKTLQHCVATYAKAMAEGRTTILFIRKIAEPEKPFYTLEYKNGKVNQNRGKKNCGKTPEVETFEEKWIEHIKQMEEKDGLLGEKRTSCS